MYFIVVIINQSRERKKKKEWTWFRLFFVSGINYSLVLPLTNHFSI